MDQTKKPNYDSSDRIHKEPFIISISVFFGVALLSVLVRFSIRAITHKRPSFDDYLVIISAAALCVAFAVLLRNLETFYLIEAEFTNVFIPTPSEFESIIDISKWIQIFVFMAWLAVFAIKFAFLAFFHVLISRQSARVTRYFWFVVIFVTICWLFLSFDYFMVCPYFGLKTIKCQTDFNYKGAMAVDAFSGLLDIISDILIISIPITLLRSTKMKTSQKISVTAMLCLSVAMIVIALIRLIGTVSNKFFRTKRPIVIWGFYWQMMEACVAVIMASVIVIRSVFIQNIPNHTEPNHHGMLNNMRQFVLSIRSPFRSRQQRAQSEESGSGSRKTAEKNYPKIPSLALTRGSIRGLTVFMRRDKTAHQELGSVISNDSFNDANYHHFRRQENQVHTSVG